MQRHNYHDGVILLMRPRGTSKTGRSRCGRPMPQSLSCSGDSWLKVIVARRNFHQLLMIVIAPLMSAAPLI